MSYIFMDESGCLGFDFSKSATSRYFVITFLFCSNKRRVEKIVKKSFQNMSSKIRKTHCGILHCFKEQPKIRYQLLRALAEEDTVTIMSICLNKKKVYANLQDEKHVLYNYVTNILLDRILTRKLIPIDQPIHLIASKRETNRFLNTNFQSYLKYKMQQKHPLDIKITISPAGQEKALQAVDFVSWSIFRYYERQDNSYYNIIKNKIVEDNVLFG